MYNQEPVTNVEIEQILENANWAPTHKLTEPWRFVVFRENGLEQLSQWLGARYEETASEHKGYSEVKHQKFLERPLQSARVIGICMQRDTEERLPEWEEVAAVACAVQNMWLTCTANGIGSYWSTPSFVVGATDFPGMEAGWMCLGLFYMGKWDVVELPAVRGSIHEKVVWVG
jgi:nitroreductase